MAVPRKLVASYKESVRLKEAFKLDGTDATGWINLYSDPTSQDRWEERWLWDSGPRYLVRLPPPTSEELLRIALQSPYEDEAIAAVVLLHQEPEQLQNLVAGMERLASLKAPPWTRIGNLVAWSGLERPVNRSPTLYKTPVQVTFDFNSWLEAAKRVTLLNLMVEGATGREFRADSSDLL